jgi:hypothetical protein
MPFARDFNVELGPAVAAPPDPRTRGPSPRRSMEGSRRGTTGIAEALHAEAMPRPSIQIPERCRTVYRLPTVTTRSSGERGSSDDRVVDEVTGGERELSDAGARLRDRSGPRSRVSPRHETGDASARGVSADVSQPDRLCIRLRRSTMAHPTRPHVRRAREGGAWRGFAPNQDPMCPLGGPSPVASSRVVPGARRGERTDITGLTLCTIWWSGMASHPSRRAGSC